MIVFCTTCRGRAQHLKETLPQNLADNKDFSAAKFLVLDYGSQDDLADFLEKDHRAEIESGRLIIYQYPDADRFQMAHAKNMAHRLGMLEGGDILVNLDADNFTGPGFAEYVEQRMEHEDMFLWSRMIKTGPERLARGISGRIAVSRNAFLCTGGYDEKYDTWSPDDKDFHARLRRLGYSASEVDLRYLDAISHPDKMRFREYPHAATRAGEDEMNIDPDATVVNAGRIGCGTVYRNFDRDAPIELKPLPTRIFGVGMHKTATTSLHAALGILGFKSGHWENAHWAKAIWNEMGECGRSKTLERHYALSDLPIPLLFRELDCGYPGSKFILTIRDEGAWLDSVRKHWSHDHNPYRASWNGDPFTHRIHREVYGQKGFEEDLFISRYRRHNAEVRDYFKDRPQDLLVMDMSARREWHDLCQFLDKPVPNVPYPKRFITVTGPDPEYCI